MEIKPIIFNLSQNEDENRFQELAADGKVQTIIDSYKEQEKELFQVENPSLIFLPDFPQKFNDFYDNQKKNLPEKKRGRWVFFPWSASVSHILKNGDFQKVRSARNKNLITESEQKTLRESAVGIAGLSVGESVALALALQGVEQFRLADSDTLSLSNLNRVPSGVASLGLPKTVITSRQIYELNPYAKIETFPEGLTEKNLEKFVSSPPKLNLVVDEMDDLAIKFHLREKARANHIPLITGADSDEKAVIDIERYDLNPNLELFGGRLGETNPEKLTNLNKLAIAETIEKLIGPENVSKKMRDSLKEMGKTVVSWPQLGSTALLNGAAVATLAREILLGRPLPQNRFVVSV